MSIQAYMQMQKELEEFSRLGIYHIQNKQELKSFRLIAFTNSDSFCFCSLCGHHIKNLFWVSDGKNIAILGSECVKTMGEVQERHEPTGIENIPQKKRSRIRNQKYKYSIDDEDLLF